jgi:hypothetical protein
VVDRLGEFIDQKKFGLNQFEETKKISLADIALASILAPIVNPPLYIEGKFGHVFNIVEKNDPRFREEIDKWRNTRAGKFTMEMYKNFRC